VVGESGCGKSVMALSMLRLIPIPPGEITSGQILLQNEDLLSADEGRHEGHTRRGHCDDFSRSR